MTTTPFPSPRPSSIFCPLSVAPSCTFLSLWFLHPLCFPSPVWKASQVFSPSCTNTGVRTESQVGAGRGSKDGKCGEGRGGNLVTSWLDLIPTELWELVGTQPSSSPSWLVQGRSQLCFHPTVPASGSSAFWGPLARVQDVLP